MAEINANNWEVLMHSNNTFCNAWVYLEVKILENKPFKLVAIMSETTQSNKGLLFLFSSLVLLYCYYLVQKIDTLGI